MGSRKDKIMDTVDKIDKDKLIKHIIRWLDHNIDEAHTIIAEDSQDLKNKTYNQNPFYYFPHYQLILNDDVSCLVA